MGNYVITQKGLYIGLFVIGIPMLYIAAYVPVRPPYSLVHHSTYSLLLLCFQTTQHSILDHRRLTILHPLPR